MKEMNALKTKLFQIVLPQIQVGYLQTVQQHPQAQQKRAFPSPFPIIVLEHFKVSKSKIQYRQCELWEHKRLCLSYKEDFRGWERQERWRLKAAVLYERVRQQSNTAGSRSLFQQGLQGTRHVDKGTGQHSNSWSFQSEPMACCSGVVNLALYMVLMNLQLNQCAVWGPQRSPHLFHPLGNTSLNGKL